MLSSEILERQFGDTQIIVMKQNDKYRIIKTVMTDGTALELSLVTFVQKVPSFPVIHNQIIGGVSMGKAYTASSIPFFRKVNSVSSCSLPTNLQSHFPNQSKVSIVVDVDILVGKSKDHYCHILEVYSQAVIWPQSPNSDISPRVLNAINQFSELL